MSETQLTSVLDQLDQLEEVVLDGTRVPFSGGRLVNEQDAIELMDAVRDALPAQLVKADELVAQAKTDLEAAKLPGYVKTVRTVCKAEWAYEIAIVMDSLDNFKGCESSLPKLSLPRSCTLPPSPTLWSPASADMGSDVRNEKLMPRLEALNKLATDPDAVYSGNRVYDEM